MAKSSNKNHVVKRAGHSEPYDERKLYASIFASCIAVRENVPTAELIAERVSQDIAKWLGSKHEITSHDIRTHAAIHLKEYNDDAAWIYKHHKNIG